MGAINFSIDTGLVARLANCLGLMDFVETGTFRGDSIAAVLPLFEHLHSIELSADLHAAAVQRFAGQGKVTLHQGDSPAVLRGLGSTVSSAYPTYFWLDAHWCADSGAVGEMSVCPLLDELAAIGRIHPDSVIAIDDARLFLAAPPAAYRASAWPTLQQVVEALRAASPTHCLMVLDDVILFHPPRAQEVLQDYARAHGTDWLAQQVKAATRDEVLAQLAAKDQEILDLTRSAEERLVLNQALTLQLTGKDQAILDLTRSAQERLDLINRLQAELEERERQALLQTAELRAALGSSEKTNTERLTLIKRLSAEIDQRESALVEWTRKLQSMVQHP